MLGAVEQAEAWARGIGRAGVELFVANAGILVVGGLEADAVAWDRALRVNTLQPVWAARALVPRMAKRGGGSIVIVASAAGLLTQHGALPYAVSKAAAVAVARWLAVSHGGESAGRISTHCVCPQAVRTGMTANADPSRQLHAASALAGADGVLSAEEVADAILEGMRSGRFLILPHPSVSSYVERMTAEPDRWVQVMQRLQARFWSSQQSESDAGQVGSPSTPSSSTASRPRARL